jgi:hypothetical protein
MLVPGEAAVVVIQGRTLHLVYNQTG